MITLVISLFMQFFVCVSTYTADLCINNALPPDILSCILPEVYTHKSAHTMQLPSVCKRWYNYFVSDAGKQMTRERMCYHQAQYRTNGIRLDHCCRYWSSSHENNDSHYQEIETLLKNPYANVNHRSIVRNITPLIETCSRLANEHHGRIIKLLLTYGASLNQLASKERWSPCSPLSHVLWRTSKCDQQVLLSIIDDFLSAGANIDGTAPYDVPLAFAIQRLNDIHFHACDDTATNTTFDAIDLLIKRGANLNVTTEGYEQTSNLLMDFIGKDKHTRSAATLRLFLQYGAQMNTPVWCGSIPTSAYLMACYQASLGDSLYLTIMHEYKPPRRRSLCMVM